MNSNTFKGKWKQLKGEVQKTWGKLTDDELAQVDGETTRLSGLLQEKYGMAQDEADREVQRFEKNHCGC